MGAVGDREGSRGNTKLFLVSSLLLSFDSAAAYEVISDVFVQRCVSDTLPFEHGQLLLNQKRNSSCRDVLAGRVFCFCIRLLCTVVPLWRCGQEGRGCGGGALTCAERGGASLSAARAPQEGSTPLCLALSKDHSAVVEQLLAAEANADVKTVVRDDRGVEDRAILSYSCCLRYWLCFGSAAGYEGMYDLFVKDVSREGHTPVRTRTTFLQPATQLCESRRLGWMTFFLCILFGERGRAPNQVVW